MGAPLGNQNATNAKEFKDALRRSLARKAQNGGGWREGLDLVADKLVACALAGESWAVIEIANRMDGKPATIIIGDSEGSPVQMHGRIVLVKPKSDA